MDTATNAMLGDRNAAWGVVTPELLEAERARVGQPVSENQPYVEVATRDAIRHWARGCGDRSPLWVDPERAARSRWGRVVAPPTIVMAMNRNIISEAARGFGGLHSWHLGSTFEWSRPIHEGDTFDGHTVLESLEEVDSRYVGGTAYDQIMRTELRAVGTDELVCTVRTHLRRFEREAGRKSTKYAGRQKHVYTDDDVLAIAEAYRREIEELRGATPRHVEDVQVGEELPSIVRGPLTTADCVAFAMGWGGSFINAHGFAWDFMSAKPSAFPRNESNIPDSPERTHYVDEFARAIGAPAAFDYGPQRIAWAGSMATNWMGDDGRLAWLKVRILRPNYHGDLVTLTGRVREVSTADATATVDILETNQLGELVADATALVELPRRKAS